MRVIGGSLGGRRLAAPPGRDTRPTSDRVREAMFSSLGAAVSGAAVLDLYAGSGALGIEALSRGATRAVFVEQAPRPAGVLQQNLDDLGLTRQAILHRTAVQRYCRQPLDGPFDLVFADPPYDHPLAHVHAELRSLLAGGALASGAVVVIERTRRDPALAANGRGFEARDAGGHTERARNWLAPERSRFYGDTVLLYLRAPTRESP